MSLFTTTTSANGGGFPANSNGNFQAYGGQFNNLPPVVQYDAEAEEAAAAAVIKRKKYICIIVTIVTVLGNVLGPIIRVIVNVSLNHHHHRGGGDTDWRGKTILINNGRPLSSVGTYAR